MQTKMKPYKLLLIEDDREQARCITKLLERAAPDIFDIRCVHTLAEGMRASKEMEADLTLLDLQLPDSPDWHYTAAAIPKFFPPVIVITFMPPKEVEVECMAYGAQRVFDKAEVLKVIEVLVGEITRSILRAIAPAMLATQNAN